MFRINASQQAKNALRALLWLALPGTHTHAHADSASALLQKVNASGNFTCTSEGGGSFCISRDKKMNILIPNTNGDIKEMVLYAHGNRGVCPEGYSGENYLKDQMRALGEHCSVAILPNRENPQAEGFPIENYLSTLDPIFGSKFNIILGGHSSGGKAIAQALQRLCSSQPNRANFVGLFDSGYDTGDAELIKNSLRSCKFKVGAYANDTIGITQQQARVVENAFPGTMTPEKVSEGHCKIPKVHFSKMLAQSKCTPARNPPQQQDQAPPEQLKPTQMLAENGAPNSTDPSSPLFSPSSDGGGGPGTEYPVDSPLKPNLAAASTDPSGKPLRPLAPPDRRKPYDPSSITRSDNARLPSGVESKNGESEITKHGERRTAAASTAAGGFGGTSNGSPELSGSPGASPTPASAKAGTASSGALDSSTQPAYQNKALLGAPKVAIKGHGSQLDADIRSIQQNEFASLTGDPAAESAAIKPAESDSLFLRCRLAHQRCLERSCVTAGGI